MLSDTNVAGEIPAWFQKNIATETVSRIVEVKGVAIHYRMWGGDRTENPGLVLVHGASANGHWWDFVAPEFMEDYRVLAIDCAGAGDSDHKDFYSVGDSAAEIMAVCRDAGLDERTILVAHSFGYFLALQATLHFNGYFGGLIGIDPPATPDTSSTDSFNKRSHQLFTTRSEAIGHFKLNQPGRTPYRAKNDYIVDYIAQNSI